jgi:Icc-related predicted phosphoesterase
MLSIAEKERVDCIIIGGDIVPHTLPDIYRTGILKAQATYLKDVFIPALRNFKQKMDVAIYLDLGNDDLRYNRRILEAHDKELFWLIHFKKYKLTDDVDIVGYMNVPPTPFGIKDWEKPDCVERPYSRGNIITDKGYISQNGVLKKTVINLESDDTIERDLDRLSEDIDRPFIFVSHSPPYNTPLDVIYNGQNIGSLSIRRFIEKWANEGLLIATFHGHIHESPSRSGCTHTRIQNAFSFNPGQGDGEDAEFRYVIFSLSENKVFFPA